MQRYVKGQRGYKIPVYTRDDLLRMGKRRRDATLYEVWPLRGIPKENVFFFDMGTGEADYRPSVLIDINN